MVLLAVVLMVAVSGVWGQGGYFLSGTRILPDQYFTEGTVRMAVASNRQDVKAIGQGMTQVANGLTFNAMLDNPALLAETRASFDVPSVMASIPAQSIPAMMYLKDHSDQFQHGTFLRQIRDGVIAFQSAATDPQRYAAMQEIQQGLQFPNDFQQSMGGTSDNPSMHGLFVVPNFQVQSGNIGLALYATGQLGFVVRSSPAVSELAHFPLPNDISDLSPSKIFQLLTIVEPLFDSNGDLKPEALPSTYAVSYVDAVGVVGYGMKVTPALNLGVNLKVINRRFSSKWIDANNYDNILNQVRDDFQISSTGYTVDLGGVYTLESHGTRLGCVIQNLLPLRKLASETTIRRLDSRIEYALDPSNNIIVFNGDTALVNVQQVVHTSIPFELSEPLLVNLGVTQRFLDNWDVSVDWVDVASQDDKHDTYLSRFRVGTEFRLDALRDYLGLAVRTGMADKHPTFGLGLNLFRVLQVDGAYAYNTFTDENSYFAQVKVGW
jgi:hypothetical protein